MQFADSVGPDQRVPCSSICTTVSIDTVSGLRRPRSACAYAQADQGLRCPQITKGSFSCVAHHILFRSFNCQYLGMIDKYKYSLKVLLQQGISEPEF